jgi:hypothetical protein
MVRLAPKHIRGRLLEIPIAWEMYNFHVCCVIGPHEDLPRYLRYRQKIDYAYPEGSGIAGLYFRHLGDYAGVLWLASVPRKPHQLGFLAHEMGHASMDLVRYAGMRLNGKTEETLCYALAYGVERVLEQVRNG